MRNNPDDIANQFINFIKKELKKLEKETSNVLEGLLQTIGQSGYEQNQKINRATLVNACTSVGNTSDPDNVDFWQRLGGKVLNLGKTDWNRVAMAS